MGRQICETVESYRNAERSVVPGLAESVARDARGAHGLHDRSASPPSIEGVGLQGTAREPTGIERGDEQLVAVRREVLNDAEHAVGNLLQRLHHAARGANAGLGVQGERLQSALDDLERLLDLLFDYVSPVEVQVRPTDADRVAESLVAQLRGQGVDDITHVAAPGLRVLADTRVLSRSFLLLAQAWSCPREAGGPILIEIVHDRAGDRVRFLVQVSTTASTFQYGLATAVAGRLIELQGGELQTRPQPACACAVVLPAAG